MYFHEYLRSRYNIRYSSDASEQSRQLALKSGLDVSFTEKLLQTTGSIEKSTSVRRDDLLHVHMMIEEFYKKSK